MEMKVGNDDLTSADGEVKIYQTKINMICMNEQTYEKKYPDLLRLMPED